MAEDNKLVIALTLDDKASKLAIEALTNIGLAAKKAGKEGADSSEKHKSGMLKARDAVQSFRREMFIVGLAVGSATAAMNVFAQRNTEARTSMDRFGLAVKNWGAVIGSVMAPAFDKASQMIENLNKGLIKGALDDGLERAKIAMKNFSEDVNNLNVQFQSGQIAADQYFTSILEKQSSLIGVNREAQASLMELATLTAQVSSNERMEAERKTSDQVKLLNEYKTNYMTAHAGMAAFTATLSASIRTNLSSALTGVITGAQTAKEAFSQLGKAMIQTVVEFMMQKLVASVLEKTLLAGTVAASAVAGGAVAAAWAPAAALVSLATFGANAGPAAAGIASVNALTSGMIKVTSVMSGGGKEVARSGFGFAEGSYSVPGYAAGTDRSMAMVDSGEMIFPRTMADAIRSGQISVSGSGGGGGGGDIQINLYGITINSKENIKELAEELGFEIDRKFRNARSRV